MVSYTLISLTSGGLLMLGTGAVYSYDPVGSYEREACRAAGAAQSLIQPFLDNQVSYASRASRLADSLDLLQEPNAGTGSSALHPWKPPPRDCPWTCH